MNKLKILLIIFGLTLGSIASYAQTKAEKKRLKQELKTYKKMSPMEIRSMKLNYESKLKDKNNQLASSKAFQKKADSLQSIINNNSLRVSSLEAQLQAAQNEATSAKKGVAKGYYYRVQLGAYRNFESKAKTSKDDDTYLKETVSDMDKFTVGLFFNLEDADAFKDEMRKLGVKDAFVVPYKDGKRITHKEAVEGIRKQNGGKMPTSSNINVAPAVPLKKLLENPSGYYAQYVLVSIQRFEDLDNIINISYASNYEEGMEDEITTNLGRSSSSTKSANGKTTRGVAAKSGKKSSSSASSAFDEPVTEKGGDELGNVEVASSQTRDTNGKLSQDEFTEIVVPGSRSKKTDVRKLTYKELEDAAFSSRQVC